MKFFLQTLLTITIAFIIYPPLGIYMGLTILAVAMFFYMLSQFLWKIVTTPTQIIAWILKHFFAFLCASVVGIIRFINGKARTLFSNFFSKVTHFSFRDSFSQLGEYRYNFLYWQKYSWFTNRLQRFSFWVRYR